MCTRGLKLRCKPNTPEKIAHRRRIRMSQGKFGPHSPPTTEKSTVPSPAYTCFRSQTSFCKSLCGEGKDWFDDSVTKEVEHVLENGSHFPRHKT